MNCTLTATADPTVYDTQNNCADLSDFTRMSFLGQSAVIGAITTIVQEETSNGYDGYVLENNSFGIYYQGLTTIQFKTGPLPGGKTVSDILLFRAAHSRFYLIFADSLYYLDILGSLQWVSVSLPSKFADGSQSTSQVVVNAQVTTGLTIQVNVSSALKSEVNTYALVNVS